MLKKNIVYLCPKHHVNLETISRREGKCHDCQTVYPFEDCAAKLFYERTRKPDRNILLSETDGTPRSLPDDGPWWKDRRFIVGTVAVPVILALLGLVGIILGRDTIVVQYSTTVPTITTTIEPSSTPTSEAIDTTKIAFPTITRTWTQQYSTARPPTEVDGAVPSTFINTEDYP